MLYEELLMDSSTLLKFKLFKKIMFLGSAAYPIAQIATDMDLNYQQTVIDLTEIDKEMAAMNPDHQSILVGAGKIDSQNLSCTIDEYRYQLLQSSVPFQFILYFLNEEKPTIDDFCVKFFSSRSTVSRKIDKLKRYLKQFGLRFTYTEAGLVGDERVARLALFNIVWLGVRGIEWPFAMDEKIADDLVEGFSAYFPLSRTYVGRHELKFFAAIFYMRIKKDNFVKYDKAYDFLMRDNDYYDFADRPNSVYLLAKEYLAFAKQEFFSENPEILDHPMILGNLINISFGYYVLHHPYPTIQQMVTSPGESVRNLKQIEEKSEAWFTNAGQRSEFSGFVNATTIQLLARSFTQVLIPYFDWAKDADKVKVGVALEHNYLLVKNLYRYLSDLRFVQAEPFDSNKSTEYDLTISSSLLLKKRFPNQEVFLWDHAGDEAQMVALYKRLRKLFTEKNR
ncbi:helix-turn-helix domain-containing protein [Enterococcus sp. AD013-P3]|uniref:helix-turn-helix domain-containing protein n=1 Tax=Enterococcus sp. AD013-P3 TaxID=3411036 RepID=UPI003B94C824